MKVSIIIRTKNEGKWLRAVLDTLSKQTEKDFEVIIVDSGSTDKTLKIAKSFQNKLDLKIFKIRPEDFTYAYACNFGAEKSKGKYLCYISGHSVPINKNWLKNGLENFSGEKIAGVYGNIYALPDAGLTEKIYYGWARIFQGSKKVITKAKMGVLGNTNAIIRKNLWQEYQYNENIKGYGEDYDWARHFLKKEYKIIKDPKFSVYHSHSLGFFAFMKQYQEWRKVCK